MLTAVFYFPNTDYTSIVEFPKNPAGLMYMGVRPHKCHVKGEVTNEDEFELHEWEMQIRKAIDINGIVERNNSPVDKLPPEEDVAMFPAKKVEPVDRNPIMEFFEYEHLPEALQKVSLEICQVAEHLHDTLPDGPEKSAGLRKLLEAKDCFVRAAFSECRGK